MDTTIYKVTQVFSDLISSLIEYGFLTGSRVYGTARKDSDWDLAFPIYNSKIIEGLITAYPTKPSNYNSGYSITVGLETINLIPLHPHEFAAWYFATQSLYSSLILSDITEDQAKYSIFQAIVASYRGHLEKRSIDEYREYNDKIIDNASYMYPTLFIIPLFKELAF